ncbi:MAG: amino acid ABC transporter permease [Solobacterium sp.]|nr:amino acid ABC transporter permease [Solobacterium sp.]
MSDIFTSENLLFMLRGAGVSLLLALGAVVIGCVIGILFAAAKLSGSKVLRFIANIYVEIFRGTPMLLQVLFFYLGVPVLYQRITGTRMSANPYMVGLIALSCNSGAYQTELIRSGIQSVDKGQWEAGETLGISYPVMMKEIILPQAFKLIIPPLVSEFITLIKDSSLISNIGALELLYSAQVLGKRYYDYLDPLILAGVMYLCMTVVTSYLSKKLERRMAQSD